MPNLGEFIWGKLILSPVFYWRKMLEEIFSVKNLLRAYFKCRAGKRHTQEVLEFEDNLIPNITRISTMFKKCIFPEFIYYQFVVRQPKLRIIDATSFEIRVIQACYCEFYLYETLSPYYIEESSACQIGKGTLHAINKVKQYMIDRAKCGRVNFYVLKCDIKGFFKNINKEVLKEKLKILPVDDGIRFLYYVIDSFKGEGLPLGNRTSQLLALFYLKDIDNLIVEKYSECNYSRYADDFVIFSDNKETLIKLLNEINDICDELHIKLNHKTNVFPISNSLTYLGWKYFYGDDNRAILTIGKDRKIRARSKFKELLVFGNECGVNSYLAHLSYGSTHNFVKRQISNRLEIFKEKFASMGLKICVIYTCTGG